MQFFPLFLVLLLAAIHLVRQVQRGLQARGGAGTRRAIAQPMVRCAACGVHVPQAESVRHNGLRYCCSEHAAQAAQKA